MRAFTTFNVKLYSIQHAEGADEAVERVHESHFQEDGIQHFLLFGVGVDADSTLQWMTTLTTLTLPSKLNSPSSCYLNACTISVVLMRSAALTAMQRS
jgi:hypothetical protein